MRKFKCITCGNTKAFVPANWECLAPESDIFLCDECILDTKAHKTAIQNIEDELIKLQNACALIKLAGKASNEMWLLIGAIIGIIIGYLIFFKIIINYL